MDEWNSLAPASEELRKKLLAQELKMRKKQPEHWAKTKYRKYALRQAKSALEKTQKAQTANTSLVPAEKTENMHADVHAKKHAAPAKSMAKKIAAKKTSAKKSHSKTSTLKKKISAHKKKK